MSNAKGLLDMLLGGLGQPPQQAAGAAPGGQAEEPGPFGGVDLGGLGSRAKDSMGNLPSWAGPAALGGLAGLMLGSKGGRSLLGKGAMVGGLAALGGLAYKAYRDWEAEKAGVAAQPADLPPSESRFLPPEGDGAAEEGQALAILKAMIAAAKADGHIDAAEQKRIFEKVSGLALAADDKSLLMDELAKPLDIREIAHLATSPELAAQIYAASVLMVDEQSAVERTYLDELAGRLALPPGLAGHIEGRLA